MNFFTSDTHWGHLNICRGTSVWKDTESTRDFKTIQEMNDVIVEGINGKVKEDDNLYHLGDWAFGNPYNIQLFRKQIICKSIHFLIGNHDRLIRKNQGNVQSLFTSVQNYLEINIEKRKIVLFHYPIVSWNGRNRDSIHLFGHVHGKYQGMGKMLDVGIDSAYKSLGRYEPFSYEEILKLLDK